MSEQKRNEGYTPHEELANILTHGIGFVLSLAGSIMLINRAIVAGSEWHLVSYSIFGISLVLLYTSSVLYHALPGRHIKQILRKIDHSAIYVLIAGTYTPFLMTNLRGQTGWIMFFIVWVFAVTGIILKIRREIRSKWISATIYLIMGWLAVFIYQSMLDNLPGKSLMFLAAGGLFYTLGVIFYVWKKLPFHHAIWHLFVMGGSLCHYYSIYFIIQR
ncbi:MAG: hemolysin III family protein [Cyclobacteriaceae bacterium]|nr:hemolysin III family protein [Cyclobacteriaceae bacterium]